MKLKTIFLLILTWSAYSDNGAEVKKVMHQAVDSMAVLTPLAGNRMRFQDKKNEKLIKKHLDNLVKAFTSSKHVEELKVSGFKPSFKLIKQHLGEVQMAYNSGDKDSARLGLGATAAICMSCHTQLPKYKMNTYIIQSQKVTKKTFNDTFEYANFLYLLRKYDKASEQYQLTIAERMKVMDDLKNIRKQLGEGSEIYDRQISRSIEQLMAIGLKINHSPEEVIVNFESLESKHKLPYYITEDLKIWKRSLKRLAGKTDKIMEFNSDKEFEKFQKNELQKIKGRIVATGDYDVELLYYTGLMSNYLNTHPNTKFASEILFWLGVSENQLNRNMFYSLGDYYLLECIEQFPNSPAAKDCYQAYADEIEFRYTGTAGTNLPKELEQKLKELKLKINQ